MNFILLVCVYGKKVYAFFDIVLYVVEIIYSR